MFRKISIIIALLSAITLLVIRFIYEHSTIKPEIAITAETLIKYFRTDSPVISDSRLYQYVKKNKIAGLDIIIHMPIPINEMLLSDEISCLSTDMYSTVLKVPLYLRNEMNWEIPYLLMRSNKSYVELKYAYPIQELLKKDIFRRSPSIPGIHQVFLKERYIKKGIDGILVNNDLIAYDQDIVRNYQQGIFPTRNIFEPYSDIGSYNRMLAQYKRAIFERKNTMLIIPYFERLILPGQWTDLPSMIKDIRGKTKLPVISFPKMSHLYWPFLQILMIVSLLVWFCKSYIQVVLFSLPLIFINYSPLILNAYLIVFSVVGVYLFSNLLLLKIKDNIYVLLSSLFLYLLFISIIISAIGTSPDWLNRSFAPYGVKFVIGLSFITIFWVFQKNFRLIDFSKNMKWKDAFFVILTMLLSFYLIYRSGNQNATSFMNTLESGIRDIADIYFIIRPRFKEAFFGFPLILIAIYMIRTKTGNETISRWMLFFSMITIISVINSFWHFHSFIAYSFLRLLVDVGLGILIGVGGIGIYRNVGDVCKTRLFKSYDKRKNLTKKNQNHKRDCRKENIFYNR